MSNFQRDEREIRNYERIPRIIERNAAPGSPGDWANFTPLRTARVYVTCAAQSRSARAFREFLSQSWPAVRRVRIRVLVRVVPVIRFPSGGSIYRATIRGRVPIADLFARELIRRRRPVLSRGAVESAAVDRHAAPK